MKGIVFVLRRVKFHYEDHASTRINISFHLKEFQDLCGSLMNIHKPGPKATEAADQPTSFGQYSLVQGFQDNAEESILIQDYSK